MTKQRKHTLIIIFNKFRANDTTTYLEVIEDTDDMSCEVVELKRKPRAARFHEVLETGEGSYNHWNASKASKIYSHELLMSIEGGAR